jgi:hypothetical protein
MSDDFKIVVMHLQDGNEIIGKLLSENDRGIDLADVMLIRYGLNNSGNYVFYFNKYCPYDKSYNAFFKKDVITTIHRDVINFVKLHYENSAEKMKQINYDSILDTEDKTPDLDMEQIFSFIKNDKKLH